MVDLKLEKKKNGSAQIFLTEILWTLSKKMEVGCNKKIVFD